MQVVAVDRYARMVEGTREEYGPGDTFDLPVAELEAEQARRFPRVQRVDEQSREQRARQADAEFELRMDAVKEAVVDLAEEWQALPSELRQAERERVRRGLGWPQKALGAREEPGAPLSLPAALERLTGAELPEGITEGVL